MFMPIPFLHRHRDNTTWEQLLNKLKTYYASCTNEKELDSKGSEPLLEVTRRIRTLLPDRQASGAKHGSQAVFAPKYAHRLTSVLAYLHSIGTLTLHIGVVNCCSLQVLSLLFLCPLLISDVQVLFEIGIDGDAGVDPDFMTLWISQSELGLPSKVRTSVLGALKWGSDRRAYSSPIRRSITMTLIAFRSINQLSRVFFTT